MERLKAKQNSSAASAETYLHSSMERLKAVQVQNVSADIKHLHSSMERLKGIRKSISMVTTVKFTFQYGEIKSPAFPAGRAGRRYLHSSMERLKAAQSRRCGSRGQIYIPVWRD